MDLVSFVHIALDLEHAGLLWQPEIGDEVYQRIEPSRISVLVDPQGMSPTQLRTKFLWLPTVEQLIYQLEARQAVLFHAGLELSNSAMCYKAIVQAPTGSIAVEGDSLRSAVALSLRGLLLSDGSAVH